MSKGTGKLILSNGDSVSFSDLRVAQGLATADALMAIFGLKRVTPLKQKARKARKARKPQKRA